MNHPLALLVALLTVSGAASAQAHLVIDGQTEVEPIYDMEPVSFQAVIERMCPNAAAVLSEQTVSLRMEFSGPLAATGPTSVFFAQHVCATDTVQREPIVMSIVPTQAPGNATVHKGSLTATPEPGSMPFDAANEYTHMFNVVSADPALYAEQPVLSTEAKESPAPMLPLLLIGAALLARKVR